MTQAKKGTNESYCRLVQNLAIHFYVRAHASSELRRLAPRSTPPQCAWRAVSTREGTIAQIAPRHQGFIST